MARESTTEFYPFILSTGLPLSGFLCPLGWGGPVEGMGERERANMFRRQRKPLPTHIEPVDPEPTNWYVREGQDGPVVATHLTELEAIEVAGIVSEAVYRRDQVPNICTSSYGRMEDLGE